MKHGTKEITRDGFEYELTINFELVNENHLAKASKDRTGLFMNKPEFVVTSDTGKMILEWCNSGSKTDPTQSFVPSPTGRNSMPKIDPKDAFECTPSQNLIDATEQEVYETIQSCKSVTELLALYRQFPQYQENLKPDFEAKKSLLINLTNPNNFSKNGHSKFQ
ncbi:hypothetical protein [Chryseobacterium sp. G0201]|uniref:hypothetical protein n=1 Tax=Chryseobacterium sp. G0201 TaxID=2487065 RepID=UPI001E5CACB6|nr:hypothetical protein [Chryseobacterium sp. G0201]